MDTMSLAQMGLQWSEEIPCGGSSHPVRFAATPWDGVTAALNPCDLMPDVVRTLSGSSCAACVNGRLAASGVLQLVWLPEILRQSATQHDALWELACYTADHLCELAKAWVEPATREIIAALDSQAAARVWAGLVWAQCEPLPQYVPSLRQLVQHSNTMLRSGAAWVLSRYEQPEMVPILCRVMQDGQLEPRLRVAVAGRLTRIARGPHAARLAQCLRLPGPQGLKNELAQALESALESGLTAPADQRRAWIAETMDARSTAGDDGLRNVLLRFVRSHPGPVLDVLHELVDDGNVGRAAFAAELLAQHADPASRHALLRAWPRLSHVRDVVSEGLLEILGSWTEGTAVDFEFLVGALNVEDADVRFLALEQLGRMPDPRVIEPLITAAVDRNYSDILRRQAVYALAASGMPEAIEPLLNLYARADARIQSAATQALLALADRLPEGSPRGALCRRLLALPDECLVLRALRMLGTEGQLSVPELLDLCRHRSERVVRRAASFLAQSTDRLALPGLLELLGERDLLCRSDLQQAAATRIRNLDFWESHALHLLSDIMRLDVTALSLATVEALSPREDEQALRSLVHVGLLAKAKAVSQRIAWRLLGVTPPRSVLAALTTALLEGDAVMMRNAAEMLKALGPAGEQPALAALRSKSPRRRLVAARLLGHVAAERGRAALVAAQRDIDREVAWAAQASLTTLRQ